VCKPPDGAGAAARLLNQYFCWIHFKYKIKVAPGAVINIVGGSRDKIATVGGCFPISLQLSPENVEGTLFNTATFKG